MRLPWKRRNRLLAFAGRAACKPVRPESARPLIERDTMNIRCDVVCFLLPFFVAVTTPAFGQDSFEQDPLSIRGNRALPKTLYIAPWKRLGAPLEGDALKSRLEDKLDPVEQDLFRKELELHQDGYILE